MKRLHALLVTFVLFSAACSGATELTTTDLGDDPSGTTTTTGDTGDGDPDVTATPPPGGDFCTFLEDARRELSSSSSTEDDATIFMRDLADMLPDDLAVEAEILRDFANLALDDEGVESAPEEPTSEPDFDTAMESVEDYSIERCEFDDDFFDTDFSDDFTDSSDGVDDRGDTYGDNAELDALWDACEAGDNGACDDLFWTSPLGSEYEEFGQDCGGREREGGVSCEDTFSSDSSEAITEGASSYGDDATLDALWDGCEAGNNEDCDSLYWAAPIGSEYEEFGDNCGGRDLSGPSTCVEDVASETANTYGDDPELDALWDACEGGDDAACDTLYWQSPLDSAYEDFGQDCGGRERQGIAQCAPASITDDDEAVSTYGDDPELDVLWDACDAGDNEACDDLWWDSPVGSEYEEFADTCGGRQADDPPLRCATES